MYQGQIGLKVKIPQSGSVLEHIVYSFLVMASRKTKLLGRKPTFRFQEIDLELEIIHQLV